MNWNNNNIALLHIIDNIELYEYCPITLYFQNRDFEYREENTIYGVEYPYEAQHITAGKNVYSGETQGDVVIKSTASVIYKAEEEVKLEPGFIVEQGAEFMSYLAPCGFKCPPPSATVHDIVLCEEDYTQIGVEAKYGMTYKWTSDPTYAIGYLDDPNISNPRFTTPVTTGCHTYKYILTVTNECEESESYEIAVSFDSTPDDHPEMEITAYKPDGCSFSFTAQVGECTEMIKVEILDCNTPEGVRKTYQYTRGSAYFNGNIFNWSTPDNYDCCICKRVRISVKNICSDVWVDEIKPWPKQLITYFPNAFTPNGDGINDCYKITIPCGLYYKIYIYNRRGQRVIDPKEGIPGCGSVCVWDGGKFPDGIYYYTATVIDCDGKELQYHGFILLTRGAFLFDVDPTDSNLIIFKELNNISYTVYPNPVDDYFVITAQSKEKEKQEVTIQIIDMQGKIQKEYKTVYSFGLNKDIFDLSHLLPGIYLLKIKTNNDEKIDKLIIH